jgi:hypothetical protein
LVFKIKSCSQNFKNNSIFLWWPKSNSPVSSWQPNLVLFFLFFVFLSRQPKSFLAHSAFVAHRRSTQSLPSSSGSCRHLLCSPSGKRQCPIGFPPITGALKAIKTHRHRSSSHLPSRPSTPIKGSNTTGKLYPNSFYPQLSFFVHRAPCHQAQVTAFFLPHHRPRSYPPLALAAHSKDRLILLILPELSW